MPNYQYPQYQQITPYAQIQQMFPQPQGSVYSINSPIEIGNVPIGSTGLSVALCLTDDIMYIKSFQNGQPVIMAFSVKPFQKSETTEDKKEAPQPSNIEQRLAKLEELITKMVAPQANNPEKTKSGGERSALI